MRAFTKRKDMKRSMKNWWLEPCKAQQSSLPLKTVGGLLNPSPCSGHPPDRWLQNLSAAMHQSASRKCGMRVTLAGRLPDLKLPEKSAELHAVPKIHVVPGGPANPCGDPAPPCTGRIGVAQGWTGWDTTCHRLHTLSPPLVFVLSASAWMHPPPNWFGAQQAKASGPTAFQKRWRFFANQNVKVQGCHSGCGSNLWQSRPHSAHRTGSWCCPERSDKGGKSENSKCHWKISSRKRTNNGCCVWVFSFDSAQSSTQFLGWTTWTHGSCCMGYGKAKKGAKSAQPGQTWSWMCLHPNKQRNHPKKVVVDPLGKPKNHPNPDVWEVFQCKKRQPAVGQKRIYRTEV